MSPSQGEVRRFYLPSRRTDALDVGAPAKTASILLIEDNPADATLIREALEEHSVKCELLLIADGERAMQFMDEVESGETPCPNLIILDLNLPRKPGIEVLRQLRTSGRWTHLPIVILTSSDIRKDRDEVAALGPSQYIQKPSRLDEFMKLGGVFKDLIYGHSK